MNLAAVVVLVFCIAALASSAAEALRPGVLLGPAEIDQLRIDLREYPWKKATFEHSDTPRFFVGGGGIGENARHWAGQTIVIPAKAGHYHHFFCSCGTQLEFPKDWQPHPDKGYDCPACGKHYQGEKYDAAVRYMQHNQLGVAAFDLALTGELENNSAYRHKAAEILLKYARAYPGPHTAITEGGIFYQSLCESVWSIPLAAAYDLIYSTLSASDRSVIEDQLFRPVARGLIACGIPGNWGSWHLSAVGVIGYALQDKALIDYALSSFKKQISETLGDDGLWPESVHTYHFYPLGAFLFLAEAAWHNGTDLYSWEARPGKGLKAMFDAPLRYMYPSFQLPAINDGWYKANLPLNQYELAFARYQTPELAWALKEGYKRLHCEREGLWTILHGCPLPDKVSPPALGSINYPVLGIAVLRSPGGSVMTFDYGPYLGHGQLDKMGVTLYAGGRLMCADYGTPGYASELVTWATHTPAHNTVTVDGQSQHQTKERRLLHFAVTDDFDVAQAITEEAYPGVSHTRTLIRAGDCFLMRDELRSSTAHTYDWFLRSEGHLALSTNGSPSAQPFAYKYVSETKRISVSGPWDAEWTLSDCGLRVQMLDEAPSVVCQAQCPAETAMRQVDLLIARRCSQNATFTTALLPHSGASQPACIFSDGAFQITTGNTIDLISFGSSSALTTDAPFAWVRLQDGRPVSAAVSEGRRLTYQGQDLIQEQTAGPHTWKTP